MITREYTILHGVGLHARPAARFAKLAKSFGSSIRVKNLTRNGEQVDAKSLVKVIKMAAAQGHTIELSIDGSDEEAAAEALGSFLTDVPEDER